MAPPVQLGNNHLTPCWFLNFLTHKKMICMWLCEISLWSTTNLQEFCLSQIGCVPMWHTAYNQSVTDVYDPNSLCTCSTSVDSFSHSNLSTMILKTKSPPRDIRDETVDLQKNGIHYKTLVRRRHLSTWLLGNGRNIISVALDLELHAWSCLMAAWTTVTENTLQWTEILQVPLLKKAHVPAHLKFYNEHLNNSEKD